MCLVMIRYVGPLRCCHVLRRKAVVYNLQRPLHVRLPMRRENAGNGSDLSLSQGLNVPKLLELFKQGKEVRHQYQCSWAPIAYHVDEIGVCVHGIPYQVSPHDPQRLSSFHGLYYPSNMSYSSLVATSHVRPPFARVAFLVEETVSTPRLLQKVP